MKCCQKHWTEVREGCTARDLARFIPEDGMEAAENIMLELTGSEPPFDPLMGTVNQITATVMERIGQTQGPQAALSFFADPDACAFCVIQESFDGYGDNPRPPEALDASGWISHKLDAAKKYALEQGYYRTQQGDDT